MIDVENELQGIGEISEEQHRAELRKERGKAMTDNLMRYWRATPRPMAELYAKRCLDADPLTERYFELVKHAKAIDGRKDKVAAENWKAAGICRRLFRPIFFRQ